MNFAIFLFSHFAINVRENVLLAIGNLFVLPCPVLLGQHCPRLDSCPLAVVLPVAFPSFSLFFPVCCAL